MRELIFTTGVMKDSIKIENKSFVDQIDCEDNENEILYNLIEKMRLSQGQLDILNCYMAGMTFAQIAEFLSVNRSTVWRRKQQLQQIYTQKFATTNC